MFTGVSADAGAETTTLKSELAALQSKHDGNIRESTIARDLEAKLKTELAAAKVRASTLDGDLAKSKSDATSRHAEELKTAREQVAAEWSAKLAAEIKKARDEVTASLMSARAAEAKKFQDAAKSHEAKVLALSQADTSARSELEAAKSRHAEELKTAREGAAAEAASRHAEEVAR